MKPILLLALLLSLPVSAESVTAAWRLPIDKFAPDLKKNPDYSKLSSSPGESYFIHSGDELWNVEKALHWRPKSPLTGAPVEGTPERRDWQGDWVVWDARSRMLVARGSWEDLLAIDHLVRGLRESPNIRCRLEMTDGRDQPLKPVEAVAPEGQSTEAGQSGGLKFRFEGGADFFRVDHLTLEVGWPDLKGGGHWDVKSHFNLTDRQRTLVSQYGGADGKDGAWKLYATASEEMEDGTNPEDGTRLERPDHRGDEPWPAALRHGEGHILPAADGQAVGYFPLRDAKFDSLFDTVQEKEAPAELSAWVRGKVQDLSEGVKRIIEGRPAKCYYDSRNSMLIVIASPQDMDSAATTFEYLPETFTGNLWTTSDAASGDWGVLYSPRTTGIIEHSTCENKTDLQFSMYSEVSRPVARIRGSASLADKGIPAGTFSAEGDATMDQPLKLAEFSTADGTRLSMSVTCHQTFAEPK